MLLLSTRHTHPHATAMLVTKPSRVTSDMRNTVRFISPIVSALDSRAFTVTPRAQSAGRVYGHSQR